MFKDGYYEIGLLWKEDKPNLPYNRQLAVQQLQNLERKLVRSPGLIRSRNPEVTHKNLQLTKQLTVLAL